MERNALVDRLKGYACFLVLFGHVIMGIRLSGVSMPKIFFGMEKFIWSFHVALFLFLSGVVYKITGEWRGKKTRGGFILHKLYTLGVPYVAFSILYIVINSLVGGVNTEFSLSDILYIWRTPIAQYWYLYALFFLFCIWALFSRFFKNWHITVISVIVGYISGIFSISLGGIEIAFSSALAFGIGTSVNFEKIDKVPDFLKILIIILHLTTGVCLIILNKIEAYVFKELMIILGIFSSIMLISILQKSKIISKFLNFVNRFSFEIYLLHTMFTAGIRIILIRLNVTEWWIHVIVGTVFGLFASVLAAMIAERIRFLKFFFFPSKVYSLKKGDKK